MYVLLDHEVVCCFRRNKVDFVRRVTELHLSNKFHDSATVSGMRVEPEEDGEQEEDIDYFQFKTFPGHVIYPYFNQMYLLITCMHSICYKYCTPQTESDHQDFLKYTIMRAKPGPYLYIHSTTILL